MTLPRCETAIALSARNNVQKKEKHGKFVSVRCQHTHIRTSNEWLSLVHSYLHRPKHEHSQCVIIFLFVFIQFDFFFHSSDEFNSAEQAYTHKQERARNKKTMFTESFLSFNFNVCCHFDSKSNGSFSFSKEEQNRNESRFVVASIFE